MVIMIGGRGNQTIDTNEMQMDVYNLISAEWFVVNGISRFRHITWN